jgi:hypothetical protein
MPGAAEVEEVGVGGSVGTALAPASLAEPTFASAAELKEILDRLLTAVDSDPEAGPRLRNAHVAHQFLFPDLGIVLNVNGVDEGPRCLQWEFSDEISWKPQLTFEMESSVANRYLQGEENLAIALARRRIKLTGFKARAALEFLPTSGRLIQHYRRIVAEDYPHLKLG